MEVAVNVISNTECEASKGTHNGVKNSYEGWITEHMLCAVGEFELKDLISRLRSSSSFLTCTCFYMTCRSR